MCSKQYIILYLLVLLFNIGRLGVLDTRIARGSRVFLIGPSLKNILFFISIIIIIIISYILIIYSRLCTHLFSIHEVWRVRDKHELYISRT